MPSVSTRDFKASANSVLGEVLLGLRRQGNTWVANITCPSRLLRAIGLPERVRLLGTPHEGFTIDAAPNSSGVKVNYDSGRNIYLVFGVLKYGFPKDNRNKVELRAHTVGETLHLAGPPAEWIKGSNGFADMEQRNTHMRLAANPASGPLPAGPAEHPSAPVPREEASKGLATTPEQHVLLLDVLDRVRGLQEALASLGIGVKINVQVGLTLPARS